MAMSPLFRKNVWTVTNTALFIHLQFISSLDNFLEIWKTHPLCAKVRRRSFKMNLKIMIKDSNCILNWGKQVAIWHIKSIKSIKKQTSEQSRHKVVLNKFGVPWISRRISRTDNSRSLRTTTERFNRGYFTGKYYGTSALSLNILLVL